MLERDRPHRGHGGRLDRPVSDLRGADAVGVAVGDGHADGDVHDLSFGPNPLRPPLWSPRSTRTRVIATAFLNSPCSTTVLHACHSGTARHIPKRESDRGIFLTRENPGGYHLSGSLVVGVLEVRRSWLNLDLCPRKSIRRLCAHRYAESPLTGNRHWQIGCLRRLGPLPVSSYAWNATNPQ